jgi:MHS family proline/betaine transporter-like MFS transporter
VLPSLLSEQFPVETRAIGVALSFSIAVSIFGGLAPLVATWLIEATGDSLSPSYYLIFTAALSLLALVAIQWRRRRVAQLTSAPVTA